MADERRQSLPSIPDSIPVAKSHPRPSRMSLAPSRGILKHPLQDIEENNTVIGVMPIPKTTEPLKPMAMPRLSMVSGSAAQRRVSFASRRLDIYESVAETESPAEKMPKPKLQPPIEIQEESSIRRSPRLAAKYRTQQEKETSSPSLSPSPSPVRKQRRLNDTPSGSPRKTAGAKSTRSPSKKSLDTSRKSPARKSPAKKNLPKTPEKAGSKNNDTLISLGSDDGETIELTQPFSFSLRADQSPLKPQPAVPQQDVSSNKENGAQNVDLTVPLDHEDQSDMSMTLTNFSAKAWPPATVPPIAMVPPIPANMKPRYSAYDISMDIRHDINKPLESPKKILMEKIASMSPHKRPMSTSSSTSKEMDASMDMSFTKPLRDSFNRLSMNDYRRSSDHKGTDISDQEDGSDMEITRRFSQMPTSHSRSSSSLSRAPQLHSDNEHDDDDNDSGSDMELTKVGTTKIGKTSKHLRNQSQNQSDNESISGDDMKMTKPLKQTNSLLNAPQLPPPEPLQSPESSDMEFTTALELPGQQNSEVESDAGSDEENMEFTKPMVPMVQEVLDSMNDKQGPEKQVPEHDHSEDESEMELTKPLSSLAQEPELHELDHDEADLTLMGINNRDTIEKTLADDDNDSIRSANHTSATSVNSSPSMHLNTQAPLLARTQDILRSRSVNEVGYNNISIDEFLSRINVEFMDQFLKRRRNGSSFGITSMAPAAVAAASPDSTEESQQEVSLFDYVVSAASQLPLLNMYEFACQEMKKDNATVLENFAQWERDILDDNPLLFKDFVDAPPAAKQFMISQFQILKSHSRQEAKAAWYDWRTQLTKELKKELDRNLHKIQHDMREIIAPRLDSVTTKFDQVLKHKSQLKSQILHAKQKLESLRTRSTLELQKEKKERKLLQKSLITNRQHVFEAQQKLEALANETEAVVLEAETVVKQVKEMNQVVIPNKENTRVSLRESNDVNVDSKKTDFECLLRCSLFREICYDPAQGSIHLLYKDGLTIRIKESGAISLSLTKLQVHDPVQLEVLESIYRALAQDLETWNEPTVALKVARLNRSWLYAQEVANSSLRFCVALNSDINVIANKQIQLKAKLLDHTGKPFQTEVLWNLQDENGGHVVSRSTLSSIGELKSASLDDILETLLRAISN